MKKTFLTILFLLALTSNQLFSQNFYAQIQEVTVQEGLNSEY